MRHFSCTMCRRRGSNVMGLSTHVAQVHKTVLGCVPEALPGRDDPKICANVFGMNNIPPDALKERRVKLGIVDEEPARYLPSVQHGHQHAYAQHPYGGNPGMAMARAPPPPHPAYGAPPPGYGMPPSYYTHPPPMVTPMGQLPMNHYPGAGFGNAYGRPMQLPPHMAPPSHQPLLPQQVPRQAPPLIQPPLPQQAPPLIQPPLPQQAPPPIQHPLPQHAPPPLVQQVKPSVVERSEDTSSEVTSVSAPPPQPIPPLLPGPSCPPPPLKPPPTAPVDEGAELAQSDAPALPLGGQQTKDPAAPEIVLSSGALVLFQSPNGLSMEEVRAERWRRSKLKPCSS